MEITSSKRKNVSIKGTVFFYRGLINRYPNEINRGDTYKRPIKLLLKLNMTNFIVALFFFYR